MVSQPSLLPRTGLRPASPEMVLPSASGTEKELLTVYPTLRGQAAPPWTTQAWGQAAR